MAELLLGKPVAESIYGEIREVTSEHKVTLVTVGFSNPQWLQYSQSLKKSGDLCGVTVENVIVDGASPEEFAQKVQQVAKRADGVLIQQPLPKEYAAVVEAVPSELDVDCLCAQSVVKLYKGEDCLMPATPLAVLKLLDFYKIDLTGKNVVIVGRGNTVGKPLSLMCIKRNATVTVCHTKTVDLPSVCRRADILISACGVAGLITPEYVNENTVVIDVGLSFVDGKTCGDVAESVKDVARAVSPVPGGVGPVTRAALLGNLIKTK